MKLCLQIIVFVVFGLVTMSSQSADRDEKELLEYSIYFDGKVSHTIYFDKEKMGKAIADEFNDISEVYDISSEIGFSSKKIYSEMHNPYSITIARFYVNFTAETTTGVTHTMRCTALFKDAWFEMFGASDYLELSNCGNDKVKLEKTIEILYDEVGYKPPTAERETLN